MDYPFKKSEYDAVQDDFDKLEDKKTQLDSELSDKRTELSKIVGELIQLNSEIAKFNFIKKIFSKEYKAKKIKKAALIDKQNETKKVMESLLSKLSEINNAIYSLEAVVNSIPDYAKIRRKLLDEKVYKNGILFIDGNSALDSKAVDVPIEGDFCIDDLVLVHASMNMPKNGIIRAAKEKIVELHEIKVAQHRLTTHFALNGRVGNHGYNSWDKMGIIIIDPLKSHIKDVNNLLTVDTYFLGDFHLSDEAIIMIREDLIDSIPKELMSKYKIVMFSGDNITAVNKLLLMLGYKPQTIDAYAWRNHKNQKIVDTFFDKNYPHITKELHFSSFEAKISGRLKERDAIYARTVGLKELNGIKGIDNIPLDVLRKMYLLYYKLFFCTSDFVDNFATIIHFLKSNYIVMDDDKIRSLSTEEALKLEVKLKENPNLYDEMYQLLLEKILGIKELQFEELKESYMRTLTELSDRGYKDLDERECFRGYLGNEASGKYQNNIFFINGKYYLLTDDFLKRIKKERNVEKNLEPLDAYKLYDAIFMGDKSKGTHSV